MLNVPLVFGKASTDCWLVRLSFEIPNKSRTWSLAVLLCTTWWYATASHLEQKRIMTV
jgi:hypothetical protein